ncbi:MAG: DnaJ domain-containing protein [Candidatus Sericytochromatia bacterium]|uniref:DnaJ domain-containing protein n=1 Tax=Candidatus Tanganyikabacteria bacterium TaxID=2961651 RepID=A0A938BPS8_9BACT|nr:DnaJ domain-containing protein [Candidatus Tanganyikabacteria bacterium]
MPRGGYRGGKPPTKSITGEKAVMVSFRLAPETLLQLDTIALGWGTTRTGLVERLVGQAPPTPQLAPSSAELDALRVALAASQQGRQRLTAELTALTERELAYQAEITDLRDRLALAQQGGNSWARGVLHLAEDAGPEDVIRAFRDLSKRYHPDLNRDDAEAGRYFRDIVMAREMLQGLVGEDRP